VISNYNVGLAALPLAIILGVTAVKDGIEDWKRHRQDQTVNYSVARCLKHPELVPDAAERGDGEGTRRRKRDRLEERIKAIGARVFKVQRHSTVAVDAHANDRDPIDWEPRFWKDIRVGDIILLGNNEMIPADVLILATSEPDGACYVETKNLDGETNLKIRKGLPQTAWIQSAEDAAQFRAELHVEMPSSNLYSFLGRMLISRGHRVGGDGVDGDCKEMAMRGGGKSVDGNSSSSSSTTFEEITVLEAEVVPLDSSGLLLRGCVLRNTAYIVGVVLYTGPHTKLILNAGGTPSKRSRIERQMNPQVHAAVLPCPPSLTHSLTHSLCRSS
jgi:phospholipid-translocating ATPase